MFRYIIVWRIYRLFAYLDTVIQIISTSSLYIKCTAYAFWALLLDIINFNEDVKTDNSTLEVCVWDEYIYRRWK
jgi:hypothetical protein